MRRHLDFEKPLLELDRHIVQLKAFADANPELDLTEGIKALEEKESKEALKKYGSEDSGMKLKDILGPLINKNKK